MAIQEHINIIKQGSAVWNEWRKSEPDVYPDLSGANLANIQLHDANLSNVNFQGANLEKAELFKSSIDSCNFNKAVLKGAYLYLAGIKKSSFISANLDQSSLGNTFIAESCFNKASLHDITLVKSFISKCKFQVTDFSRKTQITNLTNASFIDVDFRGSNLSDVIFSEVDMIARVNLTSRQTNLSWANFTRANLSGAYFSYANLSNANFTYAQFSKYSRHANLKGATLDGAILTDTILSDVDLSGCKLRKAQLTSSNLTSAKLINCDLSGADLSKAILVDANFDNSDISDSIIHGCSAWNVSLKGTIQKNLIITKETEPVVSVDDLMVAQFIYLILSNDKLRNVIQTVASKGVLILGRFTPERKQVLDHIKQLLRERNYVPILLDFNKSEERDLTETITLLAQMSRFIIADLTEPSSVSHELQAIIPALAIPVQPLIQGNTIVYSMFKDYWKYHWVLKEYRYENIEALKETIDRCVIQPAENKHFEIQEMRKLRSDIGKQD